MRPAPAQAKAEVGQYARPVQSMMIIPRINIRIMARPGTRKRFVCPSTPGRALIRPIEKSMRAPAVMAASAFPRALLSMAKMAMDATGPPTRAAIFPQGVGSLGYSALLLNPHATTPAYGQH